MKMKSLYLFVYQRTLGNEKLLVCCNFSKEYRDFDFSEFKNGEVLISNLNVADITEKTGLSGYEAIVVREKLS